MSLIADALSAAQREKSGESSATRRAAAASVLRTTPVRDGAYAGVPLGLSTPLRWAAIALGGALILAAGLIYLAPDDAEVPAQAGSEPTRQLPDPATTGRVDPSELPFLDNLDPSPGTDLPDGGYFTDAGAAASDPGIPPVAAGSAAGLAYRTGDPTGPSGPASSALSNQAPGGMGVPASEAPAQPPQGSAPSGGAAPAENAPQPATVIHGRFELSVAGSSIPIDDRMAEAVAAQQAGDTGGAIVLYEQILAQRPNHIEARNNLGIALQSRGDLAGAREAFRAALAIDPRSASAWSNLGAVLSRLGEAEEAQAALGEATRLDPTNLGAKVNLANLLLARGLMSDARLLLAEVLGRDPRHAEGNYAMGKTLDSQGDRDGAVRHYEAFLTYGGARFPSLVSPVRIRIQQLTAQ